AVCTKIGPGANKCDCDEGWYGDGFDCNPVNPCNATDQCHGNANCVDIQPGMYTCRCDEGYEGNGTVCSEVDACLDNNGGCHSLASCTPTGPGTVNCTCPENLAGDGQYCYTSVASLIMSHEKLTLLAGLIKKIPSVDATLFDLGLKFTFFAPSDEAMRRFLSEKGDMEDEETIIAFLE
ncbi:stabilin-2-like, partial [Littorina saxatilis]|uniref:stabilin-2-like n=1 Tax=Littorina saxatilis TaxID=31220 RepID=UPI0038B5BFEA